MSILRIGLQKEEHPPDPSGVGSQRVAMQTTVEQVQQLGTEVGNFS